jgi:hypothetical protein
LGATALAFLATTGSARPVDVVVVARPNDQHGDVVQAELVRRRIPMWRVSLNESVRDAGVPQLGGA